MATADSEGKVRVVTAQLAGPGSFSVTAGMSQSRHNNATARVHLVSPVRLELPEYGVEWQAEQTATVPLAFYTREPDTGEELLYTDCADLDFQVALSNNKDFTVKPKQSKYFWYLVDKVLFGEIIFIGDLVRQGGASTPRPGRAPWCRWWAGRRAPAPS